LVGMVSAMLFWMLKVFCEGDNMKKRTIYMSDYEDTEYYDEHLALRSEIYQEISNLFDKKCPKHTGDTVYKNTMYRFIRENIMELVNIMDKTRDIIDLDK